MSNTGWIFYIPGGMFLGVAIIGFLIKQDFAFIIPFFFGSIFLGAGLSIRGKELVMQDKQEVKKE